MQEIWGADTHVEEANIQVQVSAIRGALHDVNGNFIETIRGEGYRFVANVEEIKVGGLQKRAYVRPLVLVSGIAVLALIDFFQGKIASGRQRIEELAFSDSPFEHASHLLEIATIDALLDDRDRATSQVLEAVGVSADRDTTLAGASILASIGAGNDASKLLKKSGETQLGGLSPELQHFIASGIALSRGDVSGRISELRAAYAIDEDPETEYLLATALMRNHDWEGALACLTDLENSKGWVIVDESSPSIIWPLAQYQMAKTYDQMGKSAESLTYYQKFISSWASGDENSRFLSDAKKRVIELKTSGH